MTLTTEILADVPLLYYKLDETSGTSATDSSGNGYHGSYSTSAMVGAGAVPAPVGGACPSWIGGTGSGRRVASPTSTLWSLPTVGSMVALVYMDPSIALTTETRLVEHEADGSDAGSHVARQVNLVSPGYVNARRNNSAANDVHLGPCGYKGQWFHLGLTWDTGRAGKFRGFINGHLMDTEDTFDGFSSLDTEMWIGAPRRTSWLMHHGHIAHLALYSTALSDARIAAHAAEAGMTKQPCNRPTVGFIGFAA